MKYKCELDGICISGNIIEGDMNKGYFFNGWKNMDGMEYEKIKTDLLVNYNVLPVCISLQWPVHQADRDGSTLVNHSVTIDHTLPDVAGQDPYFPEYKEIIVCSYWLSAIIIFSLSLGV